MTFEEERRLAELARNLSRARDLASSLAMPFVSRLIDLSLLELALQWQGRDPRASTEPDGWGLEELLQIKLRLSVIERDRSITPTDSH